MILGRRRIPVLISSIVTALFVVQAQAQIQVRLEMTKSEYVAHEKVLATVTITNRAGRDLHFYSEGPMSWLDFQVENKRGTSLTPFARRINFKSALVPAGQSVAKTIDLSSLFRLTDLGRYRVKALVRLPGGTGSLFGSNTRGFNVTKASKLYSQRIGVAGGRNTREYSVLSFSASQKSVLYVQVEDVSTGRMLQTYPLGEVLMFRRPTATVDGGNNLHVLYLIDPTTYARSRINPDGKLLGRDYYRRGKTGSPRLITFGNGEVQVAGGVPYDPKKQQRNQQKIRRVSERPAVTFR